MNTNKRNPVAGCAFAAAAALGLLWAGPASAQPIQPPAPAEPSSILEHPDPVGPGEVAPIDALPAVQQAFYLTVDQRPQTDNWDVRGVVESHSKDRLVFSTQEEGVTGELLYRLPNAQSLDVQEGQPFDLVRTTFKDNVSAGYGIDIAGGERQVAAAGNAYGETPQGVNVFHGNVAVEQTGERIEMIADNKYDTIYAIETRVQPEGGDAVMLSLGQSTEILVNRQSYNVVLLTSTETNPREEFASTAEGNRYALEFSITPAEPMTESSAKPAD
ncbi:MAG: hypothetical protein ACLFTT_08855 [Candidatus Hydrogenedentota bacterium]